MKIKQNEKKLHNTGWQYRLLRVQCPYHTVVFFIQTSDITIKIQKMAFNYISNLTAMKTDDFN